MVNSNLSNTASLLWHAYKSLPSPSSEVNWAGSSPLPSIKNFPIRTQQLTSSPGFYTLNPSSPTSKPSLILGPFQGKVACQTIAFSRGVCGTAASTQTTQLVPDVEKFPGHIACDAASQSEIVVPIVVDGVVRAIIDVDCGVKDGFDEVDRKWLEELAGILAAGCDW